MPYERVLIVDDDDDILEMLKLSLSEYVPVILTANDGETALKAFQEYKPELVITDIRMPVMDGIALIENIRKDDKSTIIAISGVDPDGLEKAMALGANATFQKPFGPRDVLTLIERLQESPPPIH